MSPTLESRCNGGGILKSPARNGNDLEAKPLVETAVKFVSNPPSSCDDGEVSVKEVAVVENCQDNTSDEITEIKKTLADSSQVEEDCDMSTQPKQVEMSETLEKDPNNESFDKMPSLEGADSSPDSPGCELAQAEIATEPSVTDEVDGEPRASGQGQGQADSDTASALCVSLSVFVAGL